MRGAGDADVLKEGAAHLAQDIISTHALWGTYKQRAEVLGIPIKVKSSLWLPRVFSVVLEPYARSMVLLGQVAVA